MPVKKLHNNSMSRESIARVRLHISGAVQGVGFRPFIYKLATELRLTGWVRNDIRGLRLEIEGDDKVIETFIFRLQNDAPSVARIKHIDKTTLELIGDTEFRILQSEKAGDEQPKPSVLPDLATCPECLKESLDPNNRRHRYPFTSCTLCGPRWSIINALPYDRPNTSMSEFPLCPICQCEYDGPDDRRFHHQANTCPACGPRLALHDQQGTQLSSDDALMQAVDAIKAGQIVAIKGIGGFQLLVDASNENAVRRLRQRKQRPRKPFALLSLNTRQISEYCEVSTEEQHLLESIAAPIVLLQKKTDSKLATSIAPGNPYLGMMLPCSILHYLLAKEFTHPLVCTSGNLSGDPICKTNEEAFSKLQKIADLYLVHNRKVQRALDDSVAQVVLGQPSLLRRARGYAPDPVELATQKPAPSLLAVGAHIKNTIALTLPGENNTTEIMLSAHLGDLDAPDTRQAFTERISSYQALYRLKPQLLIHDLHPDYHSTHYAMKVSNRKLAVQHHWAHVIACLAEHQLEEPVLGVSWDGVGLGDDGAAWGGEFLLADKQSYQRIGFLMPFSLPGGDKAATDIRRAMLGMLYTAKDEDTARCHQSLPENSFNGDELQTLSSMLQSGFNAVVTTSAGRLFDGVSCLLGLCRHNSFEGEAAMALQFAAEQSTLPAAVDLPQIKDGESTIIDWRPLIQTMVDGLATAKPITDLARLFHQTLAESIVNFVVATAHRRVALTGGCFQNRLLLQLCVESLQKHGVKVYWPQKIPANDGGIALGQAVIGLNLITR